MALAASDDDEAQAAGLGGTWTCKAEGEGIDDDQDGNFTVTISVDELGKVTGAFSSDIGNGAGEARPLKESTDDLTFRFDGDSLTLDFEAKVDLEAGAMNGTIEAAGGAFRFDWSGSRTAAQAVEAKPSESGSSAESNGGWAAVEITKKSSATVAVADEDEDASAPESKKEKKAKRKKPLKDTLDQLLPGRRYVSDIKPSRFKAKRVYATFDGHRSDDTLPYVFVSEDLGRTWSALHKKLPTPLDPCARSSSTRRIRTFSSSVPSTAASTPRSTAVSPGRASTAAVFRRFRCTTLRSTVRGASSSRAPTAAAFGCVTSAPLPSSPRRRWRATSPSSHRPTCT